VELHIPGDSVFKWEKCSNGNWYFANNINCNRIESKGKVNFPSPPISGFIWIRIQAVASRFQLPASHLERNPLRGRISDWGIGYWIPGSISFERLHRIFPSTAELDRYLCFSRGKSYHFSISRQVLIFPFITNHKQPQRINVLVSLSLFLTLIPDIKSSSMLLVWQIQISPKSPFLGYKGNVKLCLCLWLHSIFTGLYFSETTLVETLVNLYRYFVFIIII
jgi:hypothetical protein